jgi:hypothetical protein
MEKACVRISKESVQALMNRDALTVFFDEHGGYLSLSPIARRAFKDLPEEPAGIECIRPYEKIWRDQP